MIEIDPILEGLLRSQTTLLDRSNAISELHVRMDLEKSVKIVLEHGIFPLEASSCIWSASSSLYKQENSSGELRSTFVSVSSLGRVLVTILVSRGHFERRIVTSWPANRKYIKWLISKSDLPLQINQSLNNDPGSFRYYSPRKPTEHRLPIRDIKTGLISYHPTRYDNE